MKKVYLGCDHGGFSLKEIIKNYLSENGYEVEDMGAHELVEDDDYPDYVFPVAEAVVSKTSKRADLHEEEIFGVVLGRSGNGEAMSANKVHGARAVVCTGVEMARKAREHNNANILSIGADYVSDDIALEIVKTFIETHFSGDERHKRRLKKIETYENA